MSISSKIKCNALMCCRITNVILQGNNKHHRNRKKAKLLKFPKNTAIRPVLIYAGELEQAVLDEDYFDRVVDVAGVLR